MSREGMFPELRASGWALFGFWALVALTMPYSTSAARVRPGEQQQQPCQPWECDGWRGTIVVQALLDACLRTFRTSSGTESQSPSHRAVSS